MGIIPEICTRVFPRTIAEKATLLRVSIPDDVAVLNVLDHFES